MAANVVLITEEEAEVLRDVLARCEEGAILVFPDTAKAFEKKHGASLDELNGECIEYDYGGEPGIMIDRLGVEEDEDAMTFCEEALCKELDLLPDDEGEDEEGEDEEGKDDGE